ncbi:Fic family protein [Ralstonia mojiangensis]|uniref:Fic family protein n=1 Tax=Ralstonia mojiangensis TaxID=2953895 RepID=UPI0020909104|nr:Fic family protein [Ralstonia mojiangensis]MCO5413496.1 Fic family protein [Ralstonia mojiangensis]
MSVTEPNPTPARPLSRAGAELARQLDLPLAVRSAATYQRVFLDSYVPNASWLIPPEVAEDLYRLGHLGEAEPPGTYARKVFVQMVVDLAWNSSRLEGNQYSRRAVKELFKGGDTPFDVDAVMLLNHKVAIEFLVEDVPREGLSAYVVRNLHAALMQDLLADSRSLGTIRKTQVSITDTRYVPIQSHGLLEQLLDSVIAKACRIRNPIEAALFLWVHLAYLQPFLDGNKRTSRLAANIPLLLHNCAPLSFEDVTAIDYARAVLGVYEFQNVALAVDLFSWTYHRSVHMYSAQIESPPTMGD